MVKSKCLEIFCNDDNHSEREWIIGVLFKELLGVDYNLHFIRTEHYEIHYEGKVFKINDCFFRYFHYPLSYLSSENFPTNISFSTISLKGAEFPIVLLYGKNELKNSKDGGITYGVDFFASAFFMLSRWEEYCIEAKDQYGTCNENELLSIKYSFFDRPIVNEYVAILKELLFDYLGYPVSDGKRKGKIYITYDVDALFFSWRRNLKGIIRTLGGDLLKRKSVPLFFSRLHFVMTHAGKDLYDSFEEIERHARGLAPLFFFKMQALGEKGVTYHWKDDNVAMLIDKLVKRNSRIGLHTSEVAYNDGDLLNWEISRLQSLLPDHSLYYNRNHTLLYDLNQMDALSRYGVKVDSTFGFHYHNGFRCGICQEYPMYNYLQRRRMNMNQLPFCIKDNGSFYLDKSSETMWENIIGILNTIKRYNGDVVLLWHTNKLNIFEYSPYKGIHFKLISYLRQMYNEQFVNSTFGKE